MTHFINRKSNGVFIIAATPFLPIGAVDHNSLKKLVEFYISHGVSGITILGMMGEANKMSPEERRSIIDTVLTSSEGLPVVVGVSDPGLDNVVNLGRFAMDRGAAGLMLTPAAGTAREDRIEGYFHDVCAALGNDVPLVFQDFPLVTGLPVSPALIRRLTTDCPQIVMLKHEDWPGLNKISSLREHETSDDIARLSILVGNGALYLPQELQRGADGAMTGFSFPEALVQTVALHHNGSADMAEDIFDKYLPLLRYEQQPGYGLAVRKHILMMRNAIDFDITRSPGPKLTSQDKAEIERLMYRLKIRLSE